MRKQLKLFIDKENILRKLDDYEALTANPHKLAIYTPEAHGVDVTATMRDLGIELEWPPEKYVWKIAVVGWPMDETIKKSELDYSS